MGAFTWGVRIRSTAITRLAVDGTSVLVEFVNDAAHLESATADAASR